MMPTSIHPKEEQGKTHPSHGSDRHEMPHLRTLRRLGAGIVVLSLLYILLDRINWLFSARNGSITRGPLPEDNHDPNWNLFYHLGGNGPWIPHRSPLGSITDPLPSHCVVDQVHMMSRHAERYPTRSVGIRHLTLIDRLDRANHKLKGSLAFVKDWRYFTHPNDPTFDDLTTSGPYAGTEQAKRTGKKLRELYGHLVHADRRTRFWSCETPRDVETAKWFAKGFWGEDWKESKLAEMEVVSEESDRGADTLTPGDTCLKYIEDTEEGHDMGYGKLAAWQNTFTRSIAERLQHDAGGVWLGPVEIYSMMEMCGFEILARGSSPWCDVFTQDEWRAFEYGRDLLHFYRAGPGNKFSKVMGSLYLDATAEILKNESSKDVYFSFVHDGDIVPLLSTLKLLDEKGNQELPVNRLKADRNWKTSDFAPMSGRVIFERVVCGTEADSAARRYVRLSANDGVVALSGLKASGEVRHAYTLDDFQQFVAEEASYGDYNEVCGLPEDAPSKISFLHQ